MKQDNIMEHSQAIISQAFSYHHQSMLSMHKDSHTISKPNRHPPKIRIIHIYEPEIIKTSVEEFKQVVQRLTGKNQLKNKTKKWKRWSNNLVPPNGNTRNYPCLEKIKREELLLQNDLVDGGLEMKKESEEDDHLNSYLNGFGEMDNYCFNIQELVGDFTVVPLKSSNQMDNAYIEMPLC